MCLENALEDTVTQREGDHGEMIIKEDIEVLEDSSYELPLGCTEEDVAYMREAMRLAALAEEIDFEGGDKYGY